MVGSLNFQAAPAHVVRARIAAALLGETTTSPVMGEIELLAHQQDAVRRLRPLLETKGGALLADEVGLGKTYVAIALACEASKPLILAPASLRDTWQRAMCRTRVHAPFASYESLSRGRAPPGEFDFVVLDEAHHARNPSTRRYEVIVHITRSARMLLLSATPVHNGVDDLRSLLALFLGRSALRLDEEALAGCVIRRERSALIGVHVPALRSPAWTRIADDAEVLHAILDLPPPLPPREGFAGGALLTVTLARLWASSRAALRCALRRRLARAVALEAALAEGRYPTARELMNWSGDSESLQLALPLLVVGGEESDEAALAMIASVRRHADAVRSLLRTLEGGDTPDQARADELIRIHGAHGDARVIAFTQFADTASALFRRVRSRCRAAVLTASGARLAEGRLSRGEALASFAPGSARASNAAVIDVLITTDLASEGIDLHDAAVVVHLDLPWTAARLEQRIGRLRRIGSVHGETWSYALAPPAPAAMLLRTEERLRAKLEAAGRSVGAERLVLPPELSIDPHVDSRADSAERLRRLVQAWRAPAEGRAAQGAGAAVATVEANANGWLAAVEGASQWRLVASDGFAVGDDPRHVLRVAELARGGECAPVSALVEHAFEQLAAWLKAQQLREASGIADHALLAVRSPLLQRISSIAAQAPLTQRAHIGALASPARDAALRRLTLGRERDLLALASSALRNPDWLRAVVECGGPADDEGAGTRDPDTSRSIAMLLLVPPAADLYERGSESGVGAH